VRSTLINDLKLVKRCHKNSPDLGFGRGGLIARGAAWGTAARYRVVASTDGDFGTIISIKIQLFLLLVANKNIFSFPVFHFLYIIFYYSEKDFFLTSQNNFRRFMNENSKGKIFRREKERKNFLFSLLSICKLFGELIEHFWVKISWISLKFI
jgi:hypothetical protein